jgi:hypothetical protein
MNGGSDAPANDIAGMGDDTEGGLNKPPPGRDTGESRTLCMSDAGTRIQRFTLTSGHGNVLDRRLWQLAPVIQGLRQTFMHCDGTDGPCLPRHAQRFSGVSAFRIARRLTPKEEVGKPVCPRLVFSGARPISAKGTTRTRLHMAGPLPRQTEKVCDIG